MKDFDAKTWDEQQRQLDAVYRWISRTTEPYIDWDWGGEDLLVIVGKRKYEHYSYEVLCEVIDGFDDEYLLEIQQNRNEENETA
jgi:hypothetical protein